MSIDCVSTRQAALSGDQFNLKVCWDIFFPRSPACRKDWDCLAITEVEGRDYRWGNSEPDTDLE